MKKHFLFFNLCRFIFITAVITFSWINISQADLYYNTYAGTGAYPSTPFYGSGTLYYPTVLSTGTVTSINHNWGGGNVLDSGLSERVIVKYWGYIYVPGSGSQTLTFYNYSDDGFYMKINDTVVINDWQEQAPNYYNGSGSITLTGGQYYAIEVWYYENGGGAASVLYWNQSGSTAVVPTSSYALTTPAVYSSSITAAQQTRVNAFTARTISNSSVYIDQIGDNNTITVTQIGSKNQIGGVGQQAAYLSGNNNNNTVRQGNDTAAASVKNQLELRVIGSTNTLNINQGVTTTNANISSTNGHYQLVDISGSSNSLTTQQTNTGGAGEHYMETTITGSTNAVTNMQLDNGSKIMFTSINGSGNIMNATQSGTGQHYLDATLTGNGHTANITQSGSVQHKATIALTNAGGASNLSLTQNSNVTGQVYSIQQSCVTAGGCATTISQQ